jgi:hypothetical protein
MSGATILCWVLVILSVIRHHQNPLVFPQALHVFLLLVIIIVNNDYPFKL